MNVETARILEALRARRASVLAKPLRQRFAEDPHRFSRFSVAAEGFLLDYSRNLIDRDVVGLLMKLAEAAGVAERRAAMFAGEPINATEGRSVLHMALRAGPNDTFTVGGRDVVRDVHDVLARMGDFANEVRASAVTDVVNIGIGGSDLGPAMAVRALAPFHDGPRVHFVSNVDGAHIRDTLAGLDPSRTLFLVASKTFTTIETMTNAATARRWIVEELGEARVGEHFAAISTAVDKVSAFGIGADRTFAFWDWVGGRYSLWSAIGLSLMIAIGPEDFDRFLAGGRAMDRHFRDAPFEENLPVLLALIGIWNRNVLDLPTLAVLPYDQRLDRLPAYLQQLDMESNGKRTSLDGAAVSEETGPVVFGEPGTNGQHAFYQLIHQGTGVVPCDFLLAAVSDLGTGRPDHHHDLLLANCLAQGQALMTGRTEDEAAAELTASGAAPGDVVRLAPHKVFPGDRPSNTLLYRRLDPATLGRIIALYEHKVFVQGTVWGINSFDQWGVELGKTLASRLLPMVGSEAAADGLDSSTAGLLAEIVRLRAEEA